MKLNETLSNMMAISEDYNLDDIDFIGDNHIPGNTSETPMRPGAWDRSEYEKMDLIEEHFRQIMHIMGLDLSDDSLQGTPRRVAKMFIKESFSGLNPENKPKIALFKNSYQYDQMLVEKNITFYSNCEHHFVPIVGKAHVAYISNGNVIGLSKINRIVEYFAKRPQVQERFTMQIGEELKEILGTEDVAVVVDAVHLCVAARGVRDTNSSTVTSYYGGKFKEEKTRNEFLHYIKSEK